MYPNDKDKLPADGETLSSYIKRLRQQLHFSQQELANRAGIHLQSLGKLERGTRQRLNQKTKTGLANVLDIPIEYLEAVSQGKTIDSLESKKFCPDCWIAGTPPDVIWTLHRARYCLICGAALRKNCLSCGEPITSFKHKYCPHCGTPYKPQRSS
jgi:transcriptional regulator with XRE-family HTH domain